MSEGVREGGREGVSEGGREYPYIYYVERCKAPRSCFARPHYTAYGIVQQK